MNPLLNLSVLAFFASCLAAPTSVDTVRVPVHSLVYESAALAGVWSGRILYDLSVGRYDSLAVALSFEPVSSGAAAEVIESSGDIGVLSAPTGGAGRREIAFRCRISGTPAAQYRARITVVADRSSMERTVDSLLSLMSLSEKVDQCHASSHMHTPDNARLNIPGFAMCDGPFGFGCATATLFPASIAWGNTWDTTLVRRLGEAMGKEFRAGGRYVALGPMINMVRHTQAGRNFESYGEDPYLSGKLAAADVRGIQSTGTIAVPKHWVCNEREQNRDNYSSDICERTLREIYALPFEMAVKEGGAWSIMTAYNRVNSVYASENPHILLDVLKDGWGFRGFEMSDWGGTHSTVAAANAGHDLEMPVGPYFDDALEQAVNSGQVPVSVLDDKVRRILRAKLWAGVRDEPITQYQSSPNSPEHQALALEAGRKSLVLLKNEGGLLPLSKTSGTIAVVGLFADSTRKGGGGSSSVTPFYAVSPRQGFVNRIGAARVTTDYANADAAVVVVGPADDHEYSDRCANTLSGSTCAGLYNWFGDQNQYVQTVMAANPRTIVVYVGGSPVIAESWTSAPAVLAAFYPGAEQGNAIADVILGDYNPSGKLCVSWPAAPNQFVNWDLVGNDGVGPHIAYEGPESGPGYRFLDRQGLTPAWPFGHGLSYTIFEYSNIRVAPQPMHAGDHVTVEVDVRNSGNRAGEEVAQLYVSQVGASHRPMKELKGFCRVGLTPGETQTVRFELTERDFAWYDTTCSRWVVDEADFRFMAGGSSAQLPVQVSARMTVE
ncbi:MAG: glycosyl hydrolase [Chitinivibrionales bacterium]|nr:glycosyl hydrolase [Chitinivibrionales bacterium]